MKTTTDVLYEVNDHIAEITINREPYRNAQSRQVLEQLDELFLKASEDQNVRVVAIFGAGHHFSSGHDLGTPDELEDRKNRPIPQGLRGRYQHSREIYVDKTTRWRNVPKPTIAGVTGYCIFGGWMVASAMDVIYAGESAMFLGSNFQYFSIPWDVHVRQVKELLFEGTFLDAYEAQRMGFVNRVVSDNELRESVLNYARRVARNDPFQLRMTKMAVNHMQDVQGFNSHISSAHLMHMLSVEAEQDEDFALRDYKGKGRPMVQRALENYRERMSPLKNQ
ncbi:MAG: enoyl-CoA hydratase-related protein [Gammaproteobacteria bacterium]|nr:enoyl-CoA hydratase-related protein [Gammaproteobacteria bacterium]